MVLGGFGLALALGAGLVGAETAGPEVPAAVRRADREGVSAPADGAGDASTVTASGAGGSGDTARAADDDVAGGSAAPAEVDAVAAASQPATSSAPPAAARGTVPAGAVAALPGLGLSAPQSYRCETDVLGWQDPAGGVACLKVITAEPTGPINPLDGSELGTAGDAGPDYSARLTSLAILASVPGTPLEPGQRRTVRIVLFPSGSDATFFVDASGD